MKLDPQAAGGLFGYNIKGQLPAKGQYVAICLDIRDQMGVQRKKFQSEIMETKDVTRFLFGIVDAAGAMFLVQSFEFTITGAAGGNLVAFLKAWTNSDPYGFDYCTLKGTGALLTIDLKQSSKTPGLFYAIIAGISPVFPTLQGQIPQPASFAALLAVALAPPDQTQQPANQQPRQQAPAQPSYAPPQDRVALPPMPGQQHSQMTQQPPAQGPKVWVVNPATNQPILVGSDRVIIKGDRGILICSEDGTSGWVPAQNLLQFPAQVQAPPAPPLPPMPPAGPVYQPPQPPPQPQYQQPPLPQQPAQWQQPQPPAPQPTYTAPEDDIPF